MRLGDAERSRVHRAGPQAESHAQGPQPQREQDRCPGLGIDRGGSRSSSYTSFLTLVLMPLRSFSQKFNATLETLDMSFNPCCGPTLEGVNLLSTLLARRAHRLLADHHPSRCHHDQLEPQAHLPQRHRPLLGRRHRSRRVPSRSKEPHPPRSHRQLRHRHRRRPSSLGFGQDEQHPSLPRPQYPSQRSRLCAALAGDPPMVSLVHLAFSSQF